MPRTNPRCCISRSMRLCRRKRRGRLTMPADLLLDMKFLDWSMLNLLTVVKAVQMEQSLPRHLSHLCRSSVDPLVPRQISLTPMPWVAAGPLVQFRTPCLSGAWSEWGKDWKKDKTDLAVLRLPIGWCADERKSVRYNPWYFQVVLDRSRWEFQGTMITNRW